MNPRDLVNYLKGAVELSGLDQLNTESFKAVSKKVNAMKNESSPEGVFCTWLKGLLESEEKGFISPVEFTKLTKELYSIPAYDLPLQNPSIFNSPKPQPSVFTIGGNNTKC